MSDRPEGAIGKPILSFTGTGDIPSRLGHSHLWFCQCSDGSLPKHLCIPPLPATAAEGLDVERAARAWHDAGHGQHGSPGADASNGGGWVGEHAFDDCPHREHWVNKATRARTRIAGIREVIRAANGDWHEATALYSIQDDIDWLLANAERWLAPPLPATAAEGLDVERLAKFAYEDRPPSGRRPVPWTPVLRKAWQAWAERIAARLAIVDAAPEARDE